MKKWRVASIAVWLCFVCLLAAGCSFEEVPSTPSMDPVLLPTPSLSNPYSPKPAKNTPEPTPLPLEHTAQKLIEIPEGYTCPLPEGFASWQYRNNTSNENPVIDLRDVASRLLEGQKYALKNDSYVVSAQDSIHGDFTQFLHGESFYMVYFWEENENFPAWSKLRVSLDEAVKQASEYMGYVFGNDVFSEHPDEYLSQRIYLDMEGAPVELSWSHYTDGMRVSEDALYVRVMNEGYPYIALNWRELEPLNTKAPDRLISFEEAIYAINYVKSTVPSDYADEIVYADTFVSARIALVNVFSQDESIFTPAWEVFLRSGESESEVEMRFVVSMETGDVYNDYSGAYPSPFLHLSPLAKSKLFPPDTSGMFGAMPVELVQGFIEAAWNSLYHMQAQPLPEGVEDTGYNLFNMDWGRYRVELVRQQDYDEQLLLPAAAKVSVLDMYANGNRISYYYRFSVDLNRGDGVMGYSAETTAVFTWKDGAWVLLDAGDIWNGKTYSQTREKIGEESSQADIEKIVDDRITSIGQRSESMP